MQPASQRWHSQSLACLLAIKNGAQYKGRLRNFFTNQRITYFSQRWRRIHPYDDGWRVARILDAVWSHGWKEKGVTRLQEITVAFDRQRDLPADDIADLVALMLSQPVAPRARLYMQQGSLKCRLRTERNQKFGFDAIDPVTSEPHPAEHRALALAHDDSFWRGIVTQKLGNGQAKPFRKAVQSSERGSGL